MIGRNPRPLKVGLQLNPYEGITEHGIPRWNDLKAMTQYAEAAGFDSIWVPDHLVVDWPDARYGQWECWSVLSALAAVTTRIEIGSLVVCTGFRNPALLARMADTLDEISGGRLILGLGAGWHEPEFRAFGYPFDHRVDRFEEALRIIHTLLRTGRIDFKGKYYEARECELRSCGPRREGPPIMIGAGADRPRALRLTAEYADYWNGFGVNRVDRLPPILRAVDTACAKAGRDPATLQRTATLLIDLPGSEKSSSAFWLNFRSARMPATGTSEELAELLRAFARTGIGHVQIWLAPHSLAGIERFAPVLELLDKG